MSKFFELSIVVCGVRLTLTLTDIDIKMHAYCFNTKSDTTCKDIFIDKLIKNG